MGKFSTLVIGVLAGALVGVCAGVALAPCSGAETQEKIAGNAKELMGKATSFAGDIPGNVKKAVGGAQAAPASNTSSAVDDELRAKIEEARKRIAAEVAKKEAEATA